MDNRLFWKTANPLFSENCFVSNKIVLVENEDVPTNGQEVAETLNTFFSNTVRVLVLNIDNDEDFDNIILKIVNDYENHPSVIAI